MSAQYQHQPGHLTGLLRVAVEPSLEPGIRQVAAISFKNLVKADWEPAGVRRVVRLSFSLRCGPSAELSAASAATVTSGVV